MASAAIMPAPPALVITATEWPFGKRLIGKALGKIKLCFDGEAANDARPFEDGFVSGLAAGETAGVRGSGFCARGGNARLHKQDGFFLGDSFGLADKGVAVGDVFEIAGDDFGIRVVRECLDDVQLIDVGFVADADELAEADAVGVGHIENGGQKSAGLREIADRADGRKRSAKAGVELVGGNDESEAVGTDYAYAGLLGNLDDLLFELATFLADLFEAGGDYNHRFDAKCGALLHYRCDELCGDDYYDKVWRLANGRQVGVTLEILDFVGLRIDWEDWAWKTGVEHRPENFVANLALLSRSTNNSN